MSEPTGTTTPETAPAEPVDTQVPAAAVPEPADAPKPNLWDNPDSAKAEIERLRKENGAARTNAKAQAAADARNELAQSIGKALGLVADDEPADPVKLTEQLTASQTAAKQAQVELAIHRAALGVNADPSALLDSRSFLAKVADIDPNDSVAVAAAIGEAITENPSFLKNDGRRLPVPNPAIGTSGSGGAMTIDDQFAAAVKAGDVNAQIAIQNQKLAALPR